MGMMGESLAAIMSPGEGFMAGSGTGPVSAKEKAILKDAFLRSSRGSLNGDDAFWITGHLVHEIPMYPGFMCFLPPSHEVRVFKLGRMMR